MHLGRLQFDLSRRRVARLEHGRERIGAEGERWVIGTHIPATGPLDPAEVDASLTRPSPTSPRNYTDLGEDRPADAPRFGHEFTCDSWLLSDQFAEITGPESNLARFAARWEMIGSDPHGADGALFFAFGKRPRWTGHPPPPHPARAQGRRAPGRRSRLDDGQRAAAAERTPPPAPAATGTDQPVGSLAPPQRSMSGSS